MASVEKVPMLAEGYEKLSAQLAILKAERPLIVDAIERAGKADPTAIRDALESTEGLVGTTGIYTMSPEDHLGLDLSAFRMLEIRDGKWTIVD